ncbi:nanos homolog 1-like [Plodia interpunctella]|uniref:nanos homolog 1-like n=1 Tax=Plodia interpunctella TaxID=58824 RepID=UPI002367C13B|nr:nanos homolog 1-like [Plodia interpunctella]
MDISRIYNLPQLDEEGFSEVIPYPSNDVFNKDAYFMFEADNKLNKNSDTEALRAVKLDPAVLEAQLTVDAREPAEVSTLSPKTSENKESLEASFERVMLQQEAALLSLTPTQFDLLMRFTETLRQQRHSLQKQLECAFCKNNGEPLSWYSAHSLKDSRGRVRCPVLRGYRCPQCGASGDWAHTIKYCPGTSQV